MATANIYDLTDTWNASGTTFTAIKMDVTDTASDANSLLMDLQVGGSSKFSVEKDGAIFFSKGVSGRAEILVGVGGGNDISIGGAGTSNRYGLRISSNVVQVRGTLPLSWSGSDDMNTSADLSLYRDAANTLAQRNGTNAQTFNTYNTYTDASNYERGFMRWDSNVLKIGTEAAGTGTRRLLYLDSSDIIVAAAGGSNGLDFISFTNFKINGATVFRMLPTGIRPQNNGISLGDSTYGWAGIWGQELSADPTNPSEGSHVIWQSNGTGSGDDGDIMMKITAGGVTKTATLVDFSAV
jgi:hypothetical protein